MYCLYLWSGARSSTREQRNSRSTGIWDRAGHAARFDRLSEWRLRRPIRFRCWSARAAGTRWGDAVMGDRAHIAGGGEHAHGSVDRAWRAGAAIRTAASRLRAQCVLNRPACGAGGAEWPRRRAWSAEVTRQRRRRRAPQSRRWTWFRRGHSPAARASCGRGRRGTILFLCSCDGCCRSSDWR